MSTAETSPSQAWARLRAGNARFAADAMEHPDLGAARRAEVAGGQHPFAVVLGCSDSRVPAEIVFDQGLGDLFVVRTAGHVLDGAVIGSVEFGVEVLGAPLVVVLGHEGCGALRAATDALLTGSSAPGFVREVVDRVIPSLVVDAAGPAGEVAAVGSAAAARAAGRPRIELPDDDELRRRHVLATVRLLHERSGLLAAAVAEGRCAVVGLEYALTPGPAPLLGAVGAVD